MEMSWRTTSVILLASMTILTLPAPLRGANILFFTPMGSPSHIISYTPLIDELDARGHNVTYLTLFKYKSFRSSNSSVNQFFMQSVHDYLEAKRINLFHIKTFNFTLIMSAMHEMTEGSCQALLTDEAFLKVALDTSTRYDLVVMDNLMGECGLSLVALLGHPPLIYYCTAAIYSWTSWALNVPEPFAIVPFSMMPTDYQMSFKERVLNVAAGLGYLAMRTLYACPVCDAVVQQHFPTKGVPPVLDIEQNVSMVLTNSNTAIINVVRPTAPFVVEVGATHCRPAKPLSKDILDFIEGAGDLGFVYFSFGTNLRSSELPRDKVEAFVNAFKRLKQRVLWKFEAGDLPELSPNIRIEKWLPQQDLLGHPSARVFITHGGQLSVQEAVYHGVPLIGIPIFADQKTNVRVATNKGYGLYLDYDEINEDTVYDMITASISNSSFKEKAKYYSKMMKDIPMTSLETAVFWTEYVIRHQGAHHFRLVTKHLNIFQYFLLDIIGSVAIVLVVIFYIFKTLAKLALRKILCLPKRRSSESWKNKHD